MFICCCSQFGPLLGSIAYHNTTMQLPGYYWSQLFVKHGLYHVTQANSLSFAAYGFNASHSYAYAELSFRELYLKSRFAPEFYCAILNNTDDKKENKKQNVINIIFLCCRWSCGVKPQANTVNQYFCYIQSPLKIFMIRVTGICYIELYLQYITWMFHNG